MEPARLDISLRTNMDYGEEFSLRVGDTPLDVSQLTFRLQCRSAPQSPIVLFELQTVGSNTVQGIFKVEPENGYIQIRVDLETSANVFDTLRPYGYVGETINLYYDLIAYWSNGDKEPWLVGYATITKGITDV